MKNKNVCERRVEKINLRLGSQISSVNDSSCCGVGVPGNKRMLLPDAEVKPF